MIFRTTRQQERDYRSNPAISQSQLKLLLKGVHLFNSVEDPQEDYYKEKEHFIIGSAVDTLITMGKETCKEEYYISLLDKKPGDSVMSVVKEVYDTEFLSVSNITEEHFTESYLEDVIISVAIGQGYQKNWKPETKYNKIIAKGQDYWNDLVKSKGRQILSAEQFTLIKKVYTNLLEHSHTESYFDESDHIDLYYQLPLYFKYAEVDCKGLLDLCIVNHLDKTILPVDIKTMGDYTTNFPMAFFKRRYDIQAAFYTQALISDHDFIQRNNLETYTLLPFKFIVESTISPGTPLVYTCTNDVITRGKYGIASHQVEGHWFREVKGFRNAIILYNWHQENGFETDKIISESNGELDLGTQGIINR